MIKCKYSIDGKCINDEVACELCNGLEDAQVSCKPFQLSIVRFGESWIESSEKDFNKILTPMLDKMLEVQDQSQLCGEFLEWLQHRFVMFDKKMNREEYFFRGNGDYINKEEILAEFFDIDLKEAERERRALLMGIKN